MWCAEVVAGVLASDALWASGMVAWFFIGLGVWLAIRWFISTRRRRQRSRPLAREPLMGARPAQHVVPTEGAVGMWGIGSPVCPLVHAGQILGDRYRVERVL